jgi:glycosyltransferase involved in cell wall biosynthesis
MPIGFYGAWQETEKLLFDQFPDWAPSDDRVTSQYVRPDQKSEEMELADLVLVPSSFVRKTIEIKYRAKQIELAAYGVDTDFWRPVERKDSASRHMKFIYAGQISLRKGIPLLLEAWRSADIPDATLQLVGLWKLSNAKRTNLPPNVVLIEPRSPTELRRLYQESDVFVFPSYFEGFGLVLLEAMACGLPAIATNATAGPDVLSADCGIVVPMADWEALAAALMRMAGDRDRLEEMRAAARARALTHSWDRYRGQVARATARFTS